MRTTSQFLLLPNGGQQQQSVIRCVVAIRRANISFIYRARVAATSSQIPSPLLRSGRACLWYDYTETSSGARNAKYLWCTSAGKRLCTSKSRAPPFRNITHSHHHRPIIVIQKCPPEALALALMFYVKCLRPDSAMRPDRPSSSRISLHSFKTAHATMHNAASPKETPPHRAIEHRQSSAVCVNAQMCECVSASKHHYYTCEL